MVVAVPVKPLAAAVTVVLVLALQRASTVGTDRESRQSMTGMKAAGENNSHWDAAYISFHQYRIAQQLVRRFLKASTDVLKHSNGRRGFLSDDTPKVPWAHPALLGSRFIAEAIGPAEQEQRGGELVWKHRKSTLSV